MKLHITRSAWDKIMMYTALCPAEISGLGKVTIEEDGMVVTDVAIFRQSVSAAHSTIPTAALAEFQTERIQAGESMKEWCFWWHSHANLGVFFSGTDTDTIDHSTEFPYLISLVVNKKREWKARLDVHYPAHIFTDLQVEILEEDNQSIRDTCQADINAKVTVPVAPTIWKGPRDGSYTEVPGLLEKHRNAGYNTGGRDMERETEIMRTNTKTLKTLEAEESWDLDQEWQAHKYYLIQEIKKAKKNSNKNLMRHLQEELQEHLTWGKSTGIVVRDQTTNGK